MTTQPALGFWSICLARQLGSEGRMKHLRVLSVISSYMWPCQYKYFYKLTPKAVFVRFSWFVQCGIIRTNVGF